MTHGLLRSSVRYTLFIVLSVLGVLPDDNGRKTPSPLTRNLLTRLDGYCVSTVRLRLGLGCGGHVWGPGEWTGGIGSP